MHTMLDVCCAEQYTVIKLTADNHILEFAAGREGVSPASQAPEAVRVWSQRPLARRACLLDDIPKFKIREHLRVLYGVPDHQFLVEGGATGYFSLGDGGANASVNSWYGILSD